MADLKKVQYGSVVLPEGDASVTDTISIAVVLLKTYLNFSFSVNCNAPAGCQIMGQITNTTTLTFTRENSGGTHPAITIFWYVSEFNSGVTVYRGQANMAAGTSLNVTITEIDRTKSFPIISASIAGSSYNADDWIKAKLTADTTLNLAANASSVAIVEWQVIEFTGCSVQEKDISFAIGQTSRTAAISSIDTTKTLMLFTYKTDGGTTANIGQKMIRGMVTSGVLITFDRNNTGQVMDVTAYVITFSDGTSVQHNTQAFSNAETQKDVTISEIDRDKSIATAGDMYYHGGKTPYSADDNPGPGHVSMELTTITNLQLTRALTGSVTCDIGWFVTQFAAAAAANRRSLQEVGQEIGQLSGNR